MTCKSPYKPYYYDFVKVNYAPPRWGYQRFNNQQESQK